MILQYVDDTAKSLDGSEKSLNATMEELEKFYIMSGFNMNNGNTQIVWIGCKKYPEDKICSKINFDWTTNFQLLGIHYHVNLIRINKLNYDKNLK